MTAPPANPAGEIIEGNVTEIDIPGQFFILEDRQGKPFIKVFWLKALEGPADNPSYTFKKIRKLQQGYFAAPIVRMEESESAGGMKEAVLIDLPYKERPADFPKPRKGSGSNQGRPRNDKAILFMCLLKEAVALHNHSVPQGTKFNIPATLRDCIKATDEAMPDAMKAAGVQ